MIQNINKNGLKYVWGISMKLISIKIYENIKNG